MTPPASWCRVWRDGIAPQLSTDGLAALAEALARDNPCLIQGATTVPPPLECVRDWPLEAADAIVFAAWQSGQVQTVAEGEADFARVCFEADQRLGEPAACRRFLNWYDEEPRDQMRRELLEEVNRSLALRARTVLSVTRAL